MNRHKRAFTLIELLVVIAIIALLMAILMPALAKVRKQAKLTICKTNTKNLMLAATLYSQDNDYKMPVYSIGAGLWVDRISHYIENMDEARYCPSARTRGDRDRAYVKTISSGQYDWGSSFESWMWNWGTAEPEYGSYSINGYFYSDNDRGGNFGTINSVKFPNLTPVFGDSIWVDAWPDDTDTCPDDFDLNGDANYGGSMSRFIIDRHEGRISFCYADNSVNDVELKELWSLKWHNNFETVPEMTRVGGGPIYTKRR